MDDFIIAYHKDDQQKAHLINKWLVDAGYSAKVSKSCFEGGQTIEAMVHAASQTAIRIIVIFSSSFIESLTKEDHWKESLSKNPGRAFLFIIPVLIEKLDLKQLNVQKVYIDLSDLDLEKSRNPFLFAITNLLNSSSDSELIKAIF
jgi:cell division inhibitor SulA